VARAEAKREILRAIAAHDGEWYWYQLDRAISNGPSGCIGPFLDEINELAGDGLIEARITPALPGGVRYWLTDAGRVAVVECSRDDPSDSLVSRQRLA